MRPDAAFEVCHEVYARGRIVLAHKLPTLTGREAHHFTWHPDLLPRLGDFLADFELAGRAALAGPKFASRRVLFEVYYVGGAEYEAARRHMGISPMAWANWAEEIRWRVGKELVRRRIFPPARYFKELSLEPRGEGEPDGELRA
jgi:hypothetical protein